MFVVISPHSWCANPQKPHIFSSQTEVSTEMAPQNPGAEKHWNILSHADPWRLDHSGYPLVNIQETMENQHFLMGKSTISTGPCSIAMSNYPRVPQMTLRNSRNSPGPSTASPCASSPRIPSCSTGSSWYLPLDSERNLWTLSGAGVALVNGA